MAGISSRARSIHKYHIASKLLEEQVAETLGVTDELRKREAR
jgi:hypothetical protein